MSRLSNKYDKNNCKAAQGVEGRNFRQNTQTCGIEYRWRSNECIIDTCKSLKMGLERGPLSLVITEELLDRKLAAPV
jgi:hypothetical protein